MRICDYLTEDLAMVGMSCDDKAQVCEQMVDHLIEAGRIEPSRRDALVTKLLEREALSSTGIGGHVAIPHASGEKIDDMLIVLGQIPDGVEYDALDGEPVNLVFMIIGSERSPRTHLRLLAAIVRVCKQVDTVEQLINSKSRAEAYQLIRDLEND